MRSMHNLLQFHTESTSQRYSRLPPWYNKRPAQKIAHSYAIDYFAWPGLRERFIFGEHNYCDNEFWNLFCSSLRILWPYEFRDCYTREIETGLYKFSPHFDQRLCDIKSWAMGPDIFQRFPELYCDIPSFNPVPPSVTLSNSPPNRLCCCQHQRQHQHQYHRLKPRNRTPFMERRRKESIIMPGTTSSSTSSSSNYNNEKIKRLIQVSTCKCPSNICLKLQVSFNTFYLNTIQ